MTAVLTARPKSAAEPVSDFLHGVAIEDPYRWLEEQDSARTRDWIADQDAYARSYFDPLPNRPLIRERVAQLLSVETIDRPVEIAGRTFFLRRQANQEQPSIAMRSGAAGEDLVLVDPARRDLGVTAAIQILAVSSDARLLAYGVKHGGEDTLAVEFLDVDSGVVFADRLPRGTLRGLAFSCDRSSFIYSHREANCSPDQPFQVRRHQFGDAFANDEVILEVPYDAAVKGIGIVPSGGPLSLFVVNRLLGTRRVSALYLYDANHDRAPRLMIHEITGTFGPRFLGERLFAVTSDGAPNRRVVEIALPSGEWREVIAESSSRIKSVAIVADRIYIVYTADDRTPLEVYTLDGQRVPAPELPPGTITNLWSYPGSTTLFLEHTSFTSPRAVYRIDAKGITPWSQRRIPFDPAGIEVKRIWFQSKDGTRVPMFLMGKFLASRLRPTVLSAYGGFGSSLTPQFTAYGTFLIEQGCTLAIANIRGGSEFGAAWHEAAKREKRQNSFDDFCAAAEWLIESGYTTRSQLGIVGGSNAGLLVGVAITARPELFRAAVCLGPLLDMLRYHRFGNARFWIDEYGCADNPDDFRYLHSYSPYHRVRNGAEYPAVMFVSGDQDKRCDAAHARKMTARLQQASTSDRPILLDYETFRGHSPVLPLQVRIEALTRRLAFLCDQLGVEVWRSWREQP